MSILDGRAQPPVDDSRVVTDQTGHAAKVSDEVTMRPIPWRVTRVLVSFVVQTLRGADL